MKLNSILSSAIVAAALSAASAKAQDVSVQFPGYYGGVYGTLNGGYAAQPAGYFAGASLDQYWNVVNNSTGNGDGVPQGPITEANRLGYNGTTHSYYSAPGILDSTGAASALTFILTNANDNRGTAGSGGFPNHDQGTQYSQFNPTGDLSIFLAGGVEASTNAANPVSLLIGGLDPTLSYNLTAYVGSLSYYGSKPAAVNFDNQTYYLKTDAGSLSYLTDSQATSAGAALVGDYVTFYDVAGTDLESNVLTVNGEGTGLSGFQITAGTADPSAVPEPSTYVLMGAGMLTLLALRHRKNMLN